MDVSAVTPETYSAMLAFDDAASAGLDRTVAHLVRIRASQLNGCAFCVDLHVRQAREAGETDRRLDLLPVWHRATCFSEHERAALALTEALTGPLQSEPLDTAYERAAARYGESELAQLLWTIAAINAWNRIAVPTGMTAPVRVPAGRSA